MDSLKISNHNKSTVSYIADIFMYLRFMLDLKKEQKTQYEVKVTSMAGALGFKVGLREGHNEGINYFELLCLCLLNTS